MSEVQSAIIKDDDVYRQLQQHLDELPVPFPRTDSGVEIKILKRLFTPEEAKIAVMLKFSWWHNLEPLDAIAERLAGLGYTKAELETRLDTMVKKGAIMFRTEGPVKMYGNAQLIVGIFEFQVNRLTEGFVDDMHQYFKDGWLKASSQTGVSQTRVVPLGIAVDLKAQIYPYDDVKKLVLNAEGPFSVNNCVCRQVMDIKGRPCKNTHRRDVCVGMGPMAKMGLDLWEGKAISREEVLKILEENEKEGMIFQVSNAQKPDFVCSCCSCCDPNLSILSKFPTPATFITSNYVARSDPEACTGCGTCVDRCQMTAITLKDEKAEVNAFRCIGCGNCVATCGSEAMHLYKKDFETLPPLTGVDLYDRMLAERNKIKVREEKRKARQSAKK